ncbi:hypothetical protein V5F53_12245 [Xanthobacter sp. V4C-4]|uniref:hypothetical protein n=1 Tax=Xanthobacter cornucopiae TaxID=3119924 RepID=UPI00372CE597
MIEDVDFFQVLHQILAHPALFNVAPEAVRGFVHKIVAARLADDGLALDDLVAIRALVGPSVFEDALDGVPPAKVKALVTRFDPHATGLSTPPLRVRHVLALADGSASMSAAPTKKTSKRPPKPKAEEAPAPPAPAAKPGTDAPTRRKRMSGRTAIQVSDRRE